MFAVRYAVPDLMILVQDLGNQALKPYDLGSKSRPDRRTSAVSLMNWES